MIEASEYADLRQASRIAWRRAMALAFAGLVCAVLLGGLSAWFLGAVAIAGLTSAALTFNFHMPGALVRLFAIGRTAARYGERLTGHKSALTDQVLRRSELFRDMARAPGVRRSGWQFGNQSRLSDFLDDVDDIDFGKLRVDLPAATMAFGFVAGLVAAFLIAPLAAVAIMLWLLLCTLGARKMARDARSLLTEVRADVRNAANTAGAAAASVVALRAENAWQQVFAEALGSLAAADRRKKRLRHIQAGFDALCSTIGPVAAISIVAGAWLAGARGEGLLPAVFIAFAWVALGEILQAVSRAIVAKVRRDLAKKTIERWTSSMQPDDASASRAEPGVIRLDAFQRLAPNGRALGEPFSLELQRGQPTILVGASGSGKTSLLKQIAGWIGQDVMLADDGAPLEASHRQSLSMFCPHDAAILSDTVRANLFAPSATDEQLWAALAAVEMQDRVQLCGGLDGWITQDVLSLGEAQRLNLARAFLSEQPLILLDEPAEHLDTEQATRILQRFFSSNRDRIIVIASHHDLRVFSAQILKL